MVREVVLRKAPVPLRKPLHRVDRDALGEYEFARAYTIDPAVVASLGTDQYIDWEFVDTSLTDARDPLRRVRLFITYYTGQPDLVPHRPDECFVGNGYEITRTGNHTLDLHNHRGAPLKVPVRAVTFVKSSVYYRDQPTVVYTFHCNGEFANMRTDVRLRMANPFHKGAYYCKIEVRFGRRSATRNQMNAGREETIEAARKFLDQLVPVLLRDHLPDWEAVQQGRPAQS